MCANTFFDPIPTFVHVLLVAAVPLANLWIWNAVRQGDATHLSKLGLANGFALGVAGFYTLIFLPLLPLGAIAIIAFGLGFLVMAPLFSLLTAFACYRHLKMQRRKVPGVRWGFALALLILVALGIPMGITQLGLHLAAEESSETNGIRLLRAVGNRDLMLEACYKRPSLNTNMLGMLFAFAKPVPIDQARQIYFRVTGIPFNAVPPPNISGLHRQGPMNAFFDFEAGGNAVGGRLKGLSLASSRLDGSIDAEAAVSYTEWTLVFKNTGIRSQEARAEIILPHGAVVSRLTLWIDGEEREAAFAARGQVREAYQRIVRRQRDPVLVTTRGPDRVLVQCFPVPVNGEMKIRLGITAPLVLENRKEGLLRLPYFSERNFSIPKQILHSVWFESKQALSASDDSLFEEQPKDNIYTVRGMLTDMALSDVETVRALRTETIVNAWSHDVWDKKTLIVQSLQEKPVQAPQRVIFVIDASNNMRESVPAVAEALRHLPDGIEFNLLLAADEIKVFSDSIQKGNETLYKQVAAWLKTAEYAGGQDNVPALLQAWELAAKKPDSMIVWIHGPAPVLLTSVEMLAQKWSRRPDNPRLYEIQMVNGANRIMPKLEGIAAIRSIPRLGSPAHDLQHLFALWNGETKRFSFIRKTVTELPENSHKTSTHLARLWAYQEVLKQIASKERQKAVQIAARYQLVTPVSGAVVLENQAQYQEAGLHPVDPSKVPTIPEPEIWLLICVVLLMLMWVFWQSRRVRLN
jgi:NADPH-dependent ferric siderophore reductase